MAGEYIAWVALLAAVCGLVANGVNAFIQVMHCRRDKKKFQEIEDKSKI